MNSDGVEDIAIILVKEADSDSVAQIAEEICETGKRIRLKRVGTHKMRVELLKLLPSFLIAILDHTPPHLPPWSQYPGMVVQKDALGSMIVLRVHRREQLLFRQHG